MGKWKEDFLAVCKDKRYLLMLGLTALCAYGFLVTHATVGIDDTPYAYYFEEGLNVIVGRWFLFLLNKVVRISQFTPFITDLAGVMILMAAATVWCVLLYSICGERVPKWGYAFFSCIFLSCPLISEVYTYHLHNGVSVGYLCTGVSLCCFRELSRRMGNRRETVRWGVLMAVFVFAALGCYESFMVVWLLGLFLVMLTQRYMGVRCRIWRLLAAALGGAVLALALRGLTAAGLTWLFGLQDLRDKAVQRSVLDALGWVFGPEAMAEFGMAVKRVYVMYFAFGYAYLPIGIFVGAVIVMAGAGVYGAVRKRDVWLPVLTLGCFAIPFLLVAVEGKATLYRSAQFLPVICGYGAFLTALGAGRRKGAGMKGLVRKAAAFIFCVVLWNQCHDMNKWFYVDWLKYQAALDTMKQVAWELERGYDTSKPVVFTGTYQVPKSIVEDAYVGYGTETFYKINRLTGMVDEHLLEKYYRGDYGVWVAQTPALSVIDWGINAFGNDAELVRFLSMHGYGLKANMDGEVFEEASVISMEWPRFPSQGSVADMGDYIIVHF